MNILITGADGQLGNEIRVVSSRSAANRYLFTDIKELDIANLVAVEEFMDSNAISVIVNCAAYTDVDRAEEEFAAADLLNNKAVGNLAIAAKKRGALLIHISTDYLFSGEENIPYNEEHRVNPLGVYGKTKLAGEVQILKSRCNFIIIRTSWLYSSFGNNFVKTIMRLARERESLNVVFDQVGSPTYAGDLATVIFNLIESDQLSHRGIYHYSNEGVCSWYDFAVAICRFASLNATLHPCHSEEFPSRVKRPHYSVLDKTKIKRTFGIEIPYWRDSLERCLSKEAPLSQSAKRSSRVASKVKK